MMDGLECHLGWPPRPSCQGPSPQLLPKGPCTAWACSPLLPHSLHSSVASPQGCRQEQQCPAHGPCSPPRSPSNGFWGVPGCKTLSSFNQLPMSPQKLSRLRSGKKVWDLFEWKLRAGTTGTRGFKSTRSPVTYSRNHPGRPPSS